MPPKKTLNAQNLEALGAKRLTELLIEISDGNAAIKRRLRLALAGAQSPAEARASAFFTPSVIHSGTCGSPIDTRQVGGTSKCIRAPLGVSYLVIFCG